MRVGNLLNLAPAVAALAVAAARRLDGPAAAAHDEVVDL